MAGETGSKEQEVLVREFEKNAREVVRVRLTEYKGVPLIDLRGFYEDRGSGEWRPGKGLCIRREKIPELIQALQEAERLSGEFNS